MSGSEEQKFFGVRVRRKEILSENLVPIIEKSIAPNQKAAGIGVHMGENSTDSFRVGKGTFFNRSTIDYIDNIGFFPEVWITDPEGEGIAKRIVHELKSRGFKPRLHRGLPEVLQ
jgi:hypothetical protein